MIQKRFLCTILNLQELPVMKITTFLLRLTIPIETAGEYLCQSSMEVKLSESLTPITNTIEIVTSKVDKKYADEQVGTGESNYYCNLCTSNKT